MATAETRTKLPLDTFARIVGLNPLHFNQVNFAEDQNVQKICASPWYQFDYQAADRVGREGIARSIREAEESIEQFLGYRIGAAWEVDEWVPFEGSFYRPEQWFNGFRTLRGLSQTIQAKHGYFITGGIEAKTLVEADALITYSDEDTDGYSEKATISVTVAAGQDPSELCVFYKQAGVVDFAGDDTWEIRPINVTIVGTTATITFRREQAVKADLITELHPLGVDGGDAGNFATNVDVYRRYNDPSQQATILWEAGGCGCSGAGCSQCQYTVASACLMAHGDPRLSILALAPAEWNAETLTFDMACVSVGRQPDAVRLWYRAGWRDMRLGAFANRDIDKRWERVIVNLAAAKLDRPVCDCGAAGDFIDFWSHDLAYTGGAEQTATFQVTERDLNNPFGTRRGEVYAYKECQRVGEAIGHLAMG